MGHGLRDTILMLYQHRGNLCEYCGRPLPKKAADFIGIDPRHTPTVDHAIPRSRGGGDDLDNLRLACNGCNSSKGGKALDEWRERLRWAGSVLKAEHFDHLDSIGVRLDRPPPPVFYFEGSL